MEKGSKQFTALSRITGSTWGLNFEKSRLLYTSTVRSSLTHGAPVWALGDEGEGLPAKLTKSLADIQHQCLRLVTGAFKRAAGAALEQETQIPPISLYSLNLAREQAYSTRTTKAIKYITNRTNQILSKCQQHYRSRAQGWKTPRQKAQQQVQSYQRKTEASHSQNQSNQTGQTGQTRQQESWLKQQWKHMFAKIARGKTNVVWDTSGATTGQELRAGLNRSEASILTQLRTGNIGLNHYLANQRVPGILPQCRCGYPKETISHFILFCVDRPGQPRMSLQAGTRDLRSLLTQKAPAQAVAQWIFREGPSHSSHTPSK